MNANQTTADRERWFEKETKLSRLERFIINILKCGQVPKHVAIIMDGNRRYTKKANLDPLDGYKLGFEKIKKILNYSQQVGIEELTIFAFSIENFKRDQSEIDLLMNLAVEKFGLLLSEKDELVKNDVCIRFIGNLEMLPANLQKLIAELTQLTRHHKGKCLNVCMAYTSSYEIKSAAHKLYNACNQNVVNSDELTKQDLNTCLLTNDCKTEPELLIRTSGEIRLSDFLLWQCNYSSLAFTDVLWPETTFFEFSKLILKYQLDKLFNHNSQIEQVIKSNNGQFDCAHHSDLKQFVDNELDKHLSKLKSNGV